MCQMYCVSKIEVHLVANVFIKMKSKDISMHVRAYLENRKRAMESSVKYSKSGNP